MIEPVFFTVETQPPLALNAAGADRLLQRIRPALAERLAKTPAERALRWRDGPLEIEAQRVSGTWAPGAELRLAYRGARPAPSADAAELPCLELPDDGLHRLAGRLVGVDGIMNTVLLRLHCAWNGRLDRWEAALGREVPPGVREQLGGTVPFFVLSGDPGTGKTAVAQAAADRYCREAGAAGRLFYLGTDVRGNGLVGDFSGRIRAAVRTVADAAASGPAFLLIDEGYALAVRRSETQAHQEDRAATATLLQALDGLAGAGPLVLFLCTNLAQRVDPAVRRRAVICPFGRPDAAARRMLLSRWLPEAEPRDLDRAAAAAKGMTPADMERTLLAAWLAALAGGGTLEAAQAARLLRRGERTEGV